MWLDLDTLFAHPARLRPIAQALALRLAQHDLDAVCGPAIGGAFVAQMIALELDLEFFYAERIPSTTPGAMFSTRYRVPNGTRGWLGGKRIAIVDDVINAGSAIRATHADLIGCGAYPVALGALLVLGYAAPTFAAAAKMELEIDRAAAQPYLGAGRMPAVRGQGGAGEVRTPPERPPVEDQASRATSNAVNRPAARCSANIATWPSIPSGVRISAKHRPANNASVVAVSAALSRRINTSSPVRWTIIVNGAGSGVKPAKEFLVVAHHRLTDDIGIVGKADQTHRGVGPESHQPLIVLADPSQRAGFDDRRVGRIRAAAHRPFQARHVGQIGERRSRREAGQEIAELAAIVVEIGALRRMRADENGAGPLEELSADQPVDRRIGVAQRLDQGADESVAIDAQSIQWRDRRVLGHEPGRRGVVASSASRERKPPGPHAALALRASCDTARLSKMAAAWSASATSSSSAGILLSRSIRVGTAPKRAMASP